MSEKLVEVVARSMALANNDYEGPELQWHGYTDDAQAALAAIEASGIAVVQGWQDIASAPRDGTWVLLSGGETDEEFYHSDGPQSCVRRNITGAWLKEECADAVTYDDDGDTPIDWWMMNHWDGAWRSGYVNPTHWMPLPASPKAGDA